MRKSGSETAQQHTGGDLVDDWRRPITPADLVAWRQNLTERFGDLNAATRTARGTVLNSSFWAEQIRSMA